MKVFGIIMETNPLHNGHSYFIKKIKEIYQPDVLIAITSTSFTMRGDISVIDKFTKTDQLLDAGIDIILELPFTLALQSADYFAKNAIEILNGIKITDLVFGSEIDNYEFYDKCLNIINNFNNYDNKFSKKQNINTLLTEANLTKDEINIFNKPNFTLSLQYVNYIRNNNLNINYHIIKRIDNDYYDEVATTNIASATTLRKYLLDGKEINNYVPYYTNNYVNEKLVKNNLFTVVKYKYLINNNINYIDNEGITNYIINNGNFNNNFDELIDSLKNKKYTASRIRRTILQYILNTQYDSSINYKNYLRILGINKTGLKYLNTLPKETKNQLFSSPNEKNSLNNNMNTILNTEIDATKLFGIITNNLEIYKNEYKLPIRKE